MNYLNGTNKRIEELTKEDFKQALYQAYIGDITNIAPLGFSGDTIYLSINEEQYSKSYGRPSQVSVRKYGGDVELLITSLNGHFLFYGRFDYRLGLEFCTDQYWNIFNNVKHLIPVELHKAEEVKFSKDISYSVGFDILEKAIKYTEAN